MVDVFKMDLKTRKILVFLVWLFIVLSGPISVLVNSSFTSVGSNPINIMNWLQRLSGLLLFSLLFTQIMLGYFMDKLVQVVGSKAYLFHVVQGISIFFLLLLHPLMELGIIYKITESFVDTMAVFIPRISSQREIYLTYAKGAVVLLFLTIGAGYFRTNRLLRKHWRKIHILNYGVFYLIFLHMRVGSDITTAPFIYVSWIALAGVTITLALKLRNLLLKDSKKP